MTFVSRLLRVGQASALMAMVVVLYGSSAGAAGPPAVGLGTADGFAVLAGSAVTNTGDSTVNGNVGVSPGTAVSGFPPGEVNGTIHAADAVAAQAQTDLTTAYNDAAGRTGAVTVSGDLGGRMLTPGVYASASELGLTGTLTLDAQGDGAAVFIFQAGSTLTTASASVVSLIGGASPCNVFWQVGSSATLGTGSNFTGTVLALTSITVTTGSRIVGRMLARNGATTLDTDVITRPSCPVATAATPGSDGGGTTTPGYDGGGTTTPGSDGGGTTRPGSDGGTTATTAPAAGTTGGPGTSITTTRPRFPGGGSTPTSSPGGGVPAGEPPGVRPPLARSGPGLAAGLTLWGLALTTTGGLFMLVARRGRSCLG